MARHTALRPTRLRWRTSRIGIPSRAAQLPASEHRTPRLVYVALAVTALLSAGPLYFMVVMAISVYWVYNL